MRKIIPIFVCLVLIVIVIVQYVNIMAEYSFVINNNNQMFNSYFLKFISSKQQADVEKNSEIIYEYISVCYGLVRQTSYANNENLLSIIQHFYSNQNSIVSVSQDTVNDLRKWQLSEFSDDQLSKKIIDSLG